MTGLYPHQHGICVNLHEIGNPVSELPDDPSLLSRRLQAAGYHCGYSGKWHLGTDFETTRFGEANRPTLPKDVGFEGQNFPGHGNGGFGYPEYQAYLDEHGYEHEVVDGVLQGPLESTVPYFLTSHTIKMIDDFAERDAPFFIWHNFWGPHGPYLATEAFNEMYEDVAIPPWPSFGTAPDFDGPQKTKTRQGMASWDEWEPLIRHYYAFATMIDSQIGRMLDHLEKTGLLENTVVIFAADHGETLGCHGGLVDKGWNHYEDIQRIPMMVRLPEPLRPEGYEAGVVVEDFASLADLYPTILDFADADLDPKSVHGRSLRPLVESRPVAWRDAVVVEFYGLGHVPGCLYTVRKGDWKYGWNAAGADELYNLSADPYEMHNRAKDPGCAERVRDFKRLLLDWMEETGVPGVHTYRGAFGLPRE
jgi:arylsulfatase A-like enzyme